MAAAMAGLKEVLQTTTTGLGDLQGGRDGVVSIEAFVDKNGGSGTIIDLA